MYRIIYRPIATQEYQDAINWYKQRSETAAEKFIKAIDEKLDSICRNPRQYKSIYRSFYEVSTRKYPYSIVYLIEDELQQVLVISIYHHKRHPKKKYRK